MPRQKSDYVDSAAGLALRLREARARSGLSQRALARGICTPAYVSRLEKGERIPSLQLLRRLAGRLGVDADELASGVARPAIDPLLDAELALRLGETMEAEHLFTGALESDDRSERARALAGLGEIAYSIGDARGAVALLAEAGDTHPDATTAIAGTLGRARAKLGELDAAITVFEDALEAARWREDSFEELRYSVLLADALIDAGEYARATKVLRDVVSGGAAPAPAVLARLWRSEAHLHAQRGDPQTAERYARRALEALAFADQTRYAARAYKLLALIELDAAHAAQALELTDTASRLVERDGDEYELALLRIDRARALAQLDRGDEAASLALEAADAFRGADAVDAARGLALAAEVLANVGDNVRAAELDELAAGARELPTQELAVGSETRAPS